MSRGERGQAGLEYTAMLLLAGLLIAALTAAAIPARVGEEVRIALCRIFTPGAACGAAGTPPAPDRGLGILCSVNKEVDTQSYDAFLPRFVMLAGSSAGEIQQIGPDRFRVAITTENRLGVGTLDGDGPGSRTNAPPKPGDQGNEGLRTGRFGMVAGTLGGRVTTTYEFGNREEAEAYLESRRGGVANWKGWASATTGVGGRVVEEGYGIVRGWVQGLYNRVRNEPPPPPEPEPRWVTVGVNPRLQGAVGYNGGRSWSADAGGSVTLDQTLTLDMGDRLRPPTDGKDPRRFIQSATLDAGGGVSLFPPQSDRLVRIAPWLAGSAAGGGSVSFRYVTDADNQPVRLILITERFGEVGAKATGGVSNQTGAKGDRGAGGDVSGRKTKVQVNEYHLDLANPENRAAFEGVFDSYIPHITGINPLHAADPARMGALADRFARDGMEAQFSFDVTGTEGGLGGVDAPAGGKGKMVGLIAKHASASRSLDEALFRDRAEPNAQWRPLASCTAPSVSGATSGEIGGTHGPGGGGTGGAGTGGWP